MIFGLNSCDANNPGSQKYISDINQIEELYDSVVALVEPTEETMNEMGIGSEDSNNINTLGRLHRAYCSGTWISENQILTAAHCVQRAEIVHTIFGDLRIPLEESPIGDLKKISLYRFWKDDGELFKRYKVFEVSKFDRTQDLALLTLISTEDPVLNPAILELGWDPVVGEISYVIGHPVGQSWSLTEGIISYPKRKRDDGKLVTQTSAQTYFGNSGGPLINNSGKLIGVASAIIVPHLAFFVHIESIRKFLYE